MYLNSFSVRVPEGSEKTSGYVEIEHGKKYTLVLRNNHWVCCDAQVSIDGKDIGTFRVDPCSSIRLERMPDDDGRFTFYRKGSKEYIKSDLDNVSIEDLGLIRVTFTPEKDSLEIDEVLWTDETLLNVNDETLWNVNEPLGDKIYCGDVLDNITYSACTHRRDSGVTAQNCSISSGGTGLSGHSNQGFISVGSIQKDYSQQTTINLRLVERKNRSEDPRPLKPVMRSNPVPPPVS